MLAGVLIVLSGCSDLSVLNPWRAKELSTQLAQRELELRKQVESQPEDAELLHELAQVLVKENKPAEAEPYAAQAAKLNPYDAQILVTLGDANLGQKKYFPALMAYNQASQIDPDLLSASVKLAMTHELVNQTDRGLEILAKITARDPRYFEGRFQYARMLFALGRQAEARREVEAALGVSPNDHDARVLKIRILKASGNFSVASLVISDDLRQWPGDPDLLREQLDIHYQRQEWDDALKVMGQLRQKDGLETEDQLVRVEILRSKGEIQQADQLLAGLARHQPSHPGVLLALARGAISRGEHPQAMESLNTLLDIEPNQQEALYWKAVLLFRAEETDQAQTLLNAAEKINPENPQIKLLKIQRLMAERKLEEARLRIEEYLKLNPTDFRGLLVKGEWLTLTGRFAEAKQVLDGLPDHGTAILFARARLAYIQGDYNAALEGAKPLLAMKDPPWEAVYLAGTAEGRLGNTRKALQMLTPYLTRGEGLGAFHRAVGNLYQMEGNLKQAEAVFNRGLALYPRNYGLIEGASRVAEESGNWVLARDLLEAGLEKNNHYRTVFLERLSRVYRRMNNQEKARKTLILYLTASDPVLFEGSRPPEEGVLFRQNIPFVDIPGTTAAPMLEAPAPAPPTEPASSQPPQPAP
ncbi:MAG: tetratricopeptide repeat protein [Deltaproteobacteria bacterium]|nr:tetratricopeptide repeat protein [Deltaproteobacteria bacterium]